MNKKSLGTVTFLAGLTVGAATTLLNKRNREAVKDKAITLKENTVELSGKVKEKATTISQSVESFSKDLPLFQRKNQLQEEVLEEVAPAEAVIEKVAVEPIPDQLEITAELEKEVEGNEELEELEEEVEEPIK